MEDFIGIIVAVIASIVLGSLEKVEWKDIFRRKSGRDKKLNNATADSRQAMLDRSAANQTAQSHRSSPDMKPTASYIPISELRDVDSTMESAMPGDSAEPQFAPDSEHKPVVSAERQEALAAHYARWRQAIVDAQIITPKFNE